MDNPSTADLDMIEALLATMQQGSGQIYSEVDDDDDDDDYDDEDDDDDEDGYYGEHDIQTLLNPYGGAAGGAGGGHDMDDAGGNSMQMSNAQTMNFLQGLLNMNGSSLNGMADIEAAIGEGIGGMDGSSAGFLPAMQSLLPNMEPNMAGALAGAFAGGMNSLMDYSHDRPNNDDDYDDEDEEDDEEEEEDEDDDVLSDDEDDEDDDDEVGHHERPRDKQGIDPTNFAVLSGVGGLMAAGLLAGASAIDKSNIVGKPPELRMRNYHESMSAPTLMALGSNTALSRNPASSNFPVNTVHSSIPLSPGSSLPLIPVQSSMTPVSSPPPVALKAPVPSMANPVSSSVNSIVTIASTSLGNMSGGTVSKADPLAALTPIVSNLLGNSGGTTVVNTKLDSSSGSTATVIGNDSFNSSNQTLPGNEAVDGITSSLAMAKIITPTPSQTPPISKKPTHITSTPISKHMPHELQNNVEKEKICKLSNDIEDDKASLGSGSARSDASGGGKSDTESVGKKTPSPIPEGNEPRHRKAGSCASIPDLASATESMRDSDTDNHSEAHNVTANLSDLDSDIHEQKSMAQNQCPVGPLPVVVERSTYGWGSMMGLDRAKEALKSLFLARSFPAVFDGTEGSCKGILLFGPSGSGKTCLARALAKEANNALFVGISARFLLTHNPLDAIRFVRCMFDQARHEKPAVILFDEIEALCFHPYHESAIRAKDEILAQVRGYSTLQPGYPPRPDPSAINDGILVLGTTNQPWLIEDKLRRVFAYNIHVKLPEDKPRHELFRIFLQNLPNDITDEQFDCLISKSDGYSAADINTVIRQASHRVPLEPRNDSGVRMLTFDDVATVMTQYRSAYNDDQKKKYEQYIQSATHKIKDGEDTSKDRKDKPKGVKKFSHRIAKSFAAAVLAVID